MAKKNRPRTGRSPASLRDVRAEHGPLGPQPAEKPATLEERLRPEILEKLKSRQAELEAEENRRKEEQRRREEELRKAERKRLENDFEQLLNNSDLDWRKFK